MNLRSIIKLVHSALDQHSIPHALIGGLALACYGSTRATGDVDLLLREDDKEKVKSILVNLGFSLAFESPEVLQFRGIGLVDVLLARRPISQLILQEALTGGPEGMHFVRAEDLIGLKIQAYTNDPNREFQDKADIQFLIRTVTVLDWPRIKSYADLFAQWEVIRGIRDNR